MFLKQGILTVMWLIVNDVGCKKYSIPIIHVLLLSISEHFDPLDKLGDRTWESESNII